MPQGGAITISTAPADDGGVSVRVRDTGFGIPRENLSRVFDPFFTTKPPGKGAGLGLSICHGIMQRLGGRIFAESVPGTGTTITVELPLEACARTS
jgi:two-component system NtrC family sensor kinase